MKSAADFYISLPVTGKHAGHIDLDRRQYDELCRKRWIKFLAYPEPADVDPRPGHESAVFDTVVFSMVPGSMTLCSVAEGDPRKLQQFHG